MEEAAQRASSQRERVHERLIARMAVMPADELLRTLKAGTGDEKRQAAIELGNREESRAFEPLLELLADNDPDVSDGAALGLAELGDLRALPALLRTVAERSRRNLWSTVPVFAITDFASLEAARMLGDILVRGHRDEVRHAVEGLRDVWDEMPPDDHEAIEAVLQSRRDDPDIEGWRAEWIDEILLEGGWSPEEREFLGRYP